MLQASHISFVFLIRIFESLQKPGGRSQCWKCMLRASSHLLTSQFLQYSDLSYFMKPCIMRPTGGGSIPEFPNDIFHFHEFPNQKRFSRTLSKIFILIRSPNETWYRSSHGYAVISGISSLRHTWLIIHTYLAYHLTYRSYHLSYTVIIFNITVVIFHIAVIIFHIKVIIFHIVAYCI